MNSFFVVDVAMKNGESGPNKKKPEHNEHKKKREMVQLKGSHQSMSCVIHDPAAIKRDRGPGGSGGPRRGGNDDGEIFGGL